ncbi:hypothetical protein BGZ65_001581 [Modicella reniformis]|uniref:FAD-binding PCMH-type domain-containing protein n=1 Tax=Modicella reniformis TaxID=1440133 RepID=A0A9P6M9W4_9FUNG|nr:hypothetical protein BGZ65_001581 [Modicella reniformis]
MNFEDVQHAVRFAAKNNIRLVVKNTGHDYLGRSIGASSLNLWVYFMKNIDFNDNFIPDGATDGTTGQTAIILGSGVLWKDAYKAAHEHNVIVVGGAEGTVGTSGGYCQAGGHSPLSPRNGLCVDNVLQYKVVTADGELKIANAFQNKDLFWALRGGGGATFGVIVEAIYKTHPPVKNIDYAIYHLAFNTTETRQQVINSFLSYQPEWSDAGWSGYAFIQNTFMSIFYFQPDADLSAANVSFTPFLRSLESIGNIRINGTIRNALSWWESFVACLPPPNTPNAGSPTALGSRLIPRRNFESPKVSNS